MKPRNRLINSIWQARNQLAQQTRLSLLLVFLILNWPSTSVADTQQLKPPLIELQKIGLASVSLQGAKAAVSLLISNPNEVDIVVESIQYRLLLNGTQVKQSAIQQELTFPAQQKRNIGLNVSLDYDAELPLIIAALNNPDATTYEIAGSVTLKNEDTPFDFYHKDKLALPTNQ